MYKFEFVGCFLVLSMWEEEVEFHFYKFSRWQLFYCNINALVVSNLFTIACGLLMCVASVFVTDPSWTSVALGSFLDI